MKKDFDAIVVGSGFGGAVMAYRLAEASLRVCLLERGREFPPNSFPRTPRGMRENFWDPSAGLYGMLNVWSFKGSGALVSSGLGGGSLVYANILARKDERWFVNRAAGDRCYEQWPVSRADLEEHYGRVERMMNAQKYPIHHPPYDQTPKTLAMREAARKLNPDGRPGLEWLPLNLAVSFRRRAVSGPDEDDASNPPLVGASLEEARPNYHTVRAGRLMQRSTCRLCGECDIGCNFGSKNTLDYNYITEALHCGAEIRTLCEVKRFAPLADGGGYSVTYVTHDPDSRGAADRPRAPRPETTVTCDRLVLAAGTFGSTYLLLKNREAFPRLSARLGTRFSVNGDLLSFIVNATEMRGGRRVPRPLEPSFGPVITGAIRYGDTLDGHGDVGRGFYVEDGGNPALLSWLSEVSGAAGYLRRLVRFVKLTLKFRLGLSQDTDLGTEIADLLGEAVSSRTSLPVLTMGRDCPDGRLFLAGEYLDCDWRERPPLASRVRRAFGATPPASAGGGSEEYYARVRREVARIAEALGAKYLDNPAFKLNFHQVLTAHPLGGCPMGAGEHEGVVDRHGEVFNYPGLYVADGAVLPGPVGPNPSLTIGALSDRFADHIIDQHKGVTT
ncbi:MAG TPA: GMC family oxidoreductase [Pyrinomonadaceae bacterium]|nr:GMC family oxidoreductase [Pyrinomonadaceae bacterium]